MPHAIPSHPEAWLAEVAAALAAADRAVIAEGIPARDGAAGWWQRVEEHAMRQARGARGLALPVDLDGTMDEVTDLTLQLRRAAPGDPENHHVNELQHFLLYYLAAHIHARTLNPDAAGRVLRSCWEAEPPMREEGSTAGAAETDGDDDDDDDDDDEQDEPWEVSRPAPPNVSAWVAEIREAWRQWETPPPYRSVDGTPVVAGSGTVVESAVIHAMHRRGAQAPAEAIFGLVGVIEEMEDDLAKIGPEVEAMRATPPLAFAIYYIWAHILIGHADEDHAQTVVQACAQQLPSFG